MLHCPFNSDGIAPLVLRSHISFPQPVEILQSKGFLHCLLRHIVSDPAVEHDFSSIHPCLRSYVDKQIGCPHDFLVMLHHHDGIPDVAQSFEHSYQPVRVSRMQPYTRFIQNIQRAHKRTSESRDKVDSLALSSGQGIRSPVESQI